ncbi:MAG: hypothetical protein ACT4QA_17000 [Panacagrimonas sp.]
MGRRGTNGDAGLADEAARLICDEGMTDYRGARLKAAERLGLNPRNTQLDNLRIEAAVLERLRLFGGAEYEQRLRAMRHTALRAMGLLAAFRPRIAGAVLSGAIGEGHRVQIHAFADHAETVEMLFHDRQIPFDQAERRYRFADGREREVPLLRFEADGIGLDVAVFDLDAERNGPLSNIDGKPAKRLATEQLRALLEARPTRVEESWRV